MPARCIHIVADVRISFLFKANILFIRPSVHRHFTFFHLMAIVVNTMNMGIQILKDFDKRNDQLNLWKYSSLMLFPFSHSTFQSNIHSYYLSKLL